MLVCSQLKSFNRWNDNQFNLIICVLQIQIIFVSQQANNFLVFNFNKIDFSQRVFIIVSSNQKSIHMNELLQGKSISPIKVIPDDSVSQTSSTTIQRLTRRKEDSSPSRRSLSRQSSDASSDLSKFYIKMNEISSQQEIPTVRKSMVDQVFSPVKDKKRTPTPTPNRNRRKEQDKQIHCIEPIENDLIIADLQRKFTEEREAKEVYMKRVAIFERQIKAKLLIIQQIQKDHAESVKRQTATANKLQQYQQIVSLNEANLNQAKSSLEKLKNTIKQNRYAQLEYENNRLKHENVIMKQQLEAKIADINAKNLIIASLESEVALLKALNQTINNQSKINEKNREIQTLKFTIQSSKTEKQEELQRYIHKSNQEKHHLKLKIDKLQLRLNYISRRKNEELQALRQCKNSIITKLRSKISTLFSQYNSKCQQLDRYKSKQRKNAIMDEGRTAEDRFIFELSP